MSFLVFLQYFIGGFVLAVISTYLFVSFVVALFALVFLYDSYDTKNEDTEFLGSFIYMNRVGFVNFWKWLYEVILLITAWVSMKIVGNKWANFPLVWKIIKHRASLYFIKQPFAKLPPTTEDDLK